MGSFRMVPYNNDFLFRLFSRISTNPVVIGLIYFLVSYVGILVIAFIGDQVQGTNQIKQIFSQVVDNINLALIAPLGAMVLANLYSRIKITFGEIPDSRIIGDAERNSYKLFLKGLEKKYNSKIALWVSLAISLGINAFIYFSKVDSYLSISGGIAGFYGRLFIAINYFMIAFILYKSLITVLGMRRLFSKFAIKVKPLDPDNAGGLSTIGKLALAVNYFLAVVILYLSLTYIFDEFTRSNFIFVLIILLSYPLAIFLFFGSLSKANKIMKDAKASALKKVNESFDYYYEKEFSGDKERICEEAAGKMTSLKELHDTLKGMVVWPYDFKTIMQFLTSIGLPLVLSIFEMISACYGLSIGDIVQVFINSSGLA